MRRRRRARGRSVKRARPACAARRLGIDDLDHARRMRSASAPAAARSVTRVDECTCSAARGRQAARRAQQHRCLSQARRSAASGSCGTKLRSPKVHSRSSKAASVGRRRRATPARAARRGRPSRSAAGVLAGARARSVAGQHVEVDALHVRLLRASVLRARCIRKSASSGTGRPVRALGRAGQPGGAGDVEVRPLQALGEACRGRRRP